MPDENIVNKKVILLYLVNLSSDLTSHQLMTASLNTFYMDYFTFSDLSQELIRDGLLHLAQRKGETQTDTAGQPIMRYSITESGEQVLAALEHTIPIPVQQNLRRTVTEIAQTARRDESVTADYSPSITQGWQVELTHRDRDTILMQISVNVPKEELAKQICENWLNDTEKIYPTLLRLLTGEK